MSATAHKLVRMINQIAEELENQLGDAAPDAIADHIRQFWDPRMRSTLFGHVAGDMEGLRHSARLAITILQA